jgi:lipoyl(octanoyl) transferase
MRQPAVLLNAGLIDYAESWALQQRFVQERLAKQRPDTLILLEHLPVYTIGRSGRTEHWGDDDRLRSTGIPVFYVERGGSITYHGPGQLVGYPILSLARYCSGPKAYMRLLEEVMIRTLADFGVAAERRERLTGLWVVGRDSAKIAALGVRIVKGVTMHGFALNVSLDLKPFERIRPCGLSDCQATSIAEQGPAVDVLAVRQRLADHFAELFGLKWGDPAEPSRLAAHEGSRGAPNPIGNDSACREERCTS